MNYYETLGLSSDAKESEIKKAYRKLAMKHHPDRNQGDKAAEEAFKKINEAYITLSDSIKKKEYDQQHIHKTNSFGGFSREDDLNDFMNDFFRRQHGGDFNDMFGFQRGKTQKSIQISLNFWEAVFGVSKKFEIILTKNGVKTKKTVNLKFPPGTEENTAYSVDVEDIEFIVHINILPDDKYTRDHLDLYAEIEIQFTVAALGGTISFPHWTQPVDIMIPAGIQNGEMVKIPNGGISKPPYIGDMFFKVKVIVPTKLNKKQKELLTEFAVLQKEADKTFFNSIKDKWTKFFK